MLIAHPHVQRRAARADRERAIAQLTRQVKRLPQRLLLRQAQRVLLHLRLDARAHRTRRAEEPVGGGQTFQPLMRTLEVVVLDEQAHSALAVLEVGEHRPREQLLPQGLPEPLDLAERLRMLRPTADVMDAHPRELLFEFGLAAPHRVLPAVVG